jgi:hypothetical protein
MNHPTQDRPIRTFLHALFHTTTNLFHTTLVRPPPHPKPLRTEALPTCHLRDKI